MAEWWQPSTVGRRWNYGESVRQQGRARRRQLHASDEASTRFIRVDDTTGGLLVQLFGGGCWQGGVGDGINEGDGQRDEDGDGDDGWNGGIDDDSVEPIVCAALSLTREAWMTFPVAGFDYLTLPCLTLPNSHQTERPKVPPPPLPSGCRCVREHE